MKLPPPEKIYEAWSALASGRLASQDAPEMPEGNAIIKSSSGQKEYRVRWQDNIYYSTDPASWWQGYPGYPVLAVLMYRGVLPFDAEMAHPFAHVPWEEVNREFSRNYSLALHHVLKNLDISEKKKSAAQNLADKTFTMLASLDIEIRRLAKTGK